MQSSFPSHLVLDWISLLFLPLIKDLPHISPEFKWIKSTHQYFISEWNWCILDYNYPWLATIVSVHLEESKCSLGKCKQQLIILCVPSLFDRAILTSPYCPCLSTKAVKDCIWLFEQEQALGFSSVSTNIRMTVIKLKSGGLWIHAPIAPTKECIKVFL